MKQSFASAARLRGDGPFSPRHRSHAITRVIVATSDRQALLDEGIYTNLMVPPSTPAGLNIVRISLSAAHSDEDVGRMIEVLGRLSRQIKPAAA